ncbi:hypothetical protein [Sphingomonas pokkalii]|nr:hypothetical protein [Sphingomonas pokkalii]
MRYRISGAINASQASIAFAFGAGRHLQLDTGVVAALNARSDMQV